MKIEDFIKRAITSSGRGQLIPVVALGLVLLCGAAALAVDVGYWRFQQRIEQNAADSAAIAGASELAYSTATATMAPTDPTCPSLTYVKCAAKKDATTNGFTDDGGTRVTVTINNPPASGPNAGNSNAVETIIVGKQPSFFAGVFGGGTQSVQARAVALLNNSSGGCIYVLRGDLTGDLTLNGGGRGGITTSPPCGMVVNGDLSVTGSANVTVSSASYAGSLTHSGGVYPTGVSPHHAAAGSDPCARQTGCAYLQTLPTAHPELFSAACQDSVNASGVGVLPANPLPPGHYCYGSTGTGVTPILPYTSAITLQSGLFIFDRGVPTGTLSGTGVTVYNNCTVSANETCNTTLSGGTVNDSIIAPTTGVTAGVVYYQPASLENTFTFNGASGTVSAIGGVYAPNAAFTFNGQLPTISFLVAGSITMNGSGLNAGSSGGFTLPGNALLAE